MKVTTPSGKRNALTLKAGVLSLIALAIVAGAAYAGYNRTVASAAEKEISTATVVRGDVQSSVPADGRVTVTEWALSFGATGRVATVDVSEGETVTAGQQLATIDDAKAEAQVTQARSGLASAEAKLAALLAQPIAEEVAAKQAVVDAADSSLERAKEAYALLKAASVDSTVSATELQAKAAAVDSAEAQLHIAELNLAAAKVPPAASEITAARAAVADAGASLHAAEVGLEDYVLRSPADGVVLSVDLVKGQAVSQSAGQAAPVVVADLTAQRIEGQLDEADATGVRAGMPVDIIVDGLGGLVVTGHVEQVSQVARIDANELATFDVVVALDKDVADLAAGMAVRMQLITDQAADVLTIPTAAVRRTEGKSTVAIVGESGTTREQTVELGKTDGKVVEVLSGLAEGQKVALGSVTKEER